MKLKTLFIETRPQFLILSLVLGFLGTAVAWNDGYLNPGYAVLATLGLVAAHASVNTLNDFFDFRSGIDLATKPTPFSGGSGMLPTAALQPRQVFWLGIGTLLAALAVGVYFTAVIGWPLLPLLLVGMFCIVLYSPLILKNHWPEWAPGVGLGILPVMGAYFVQSSAYGWTVLVASVPSGILVHNLLFLNEFPDVEADKTANRKTMPIILGKKTSWRLYTALTLLVYVWIVAWVIAGILPVFSLLALLTLPFAFKAIKGSRDYDNRGHLVPALANNVIVVLATQFLLACGYVLAAVL